MQYRDKNNPTQCEIFKAMNLDIDADVFEKAKRNLEFKENYSELEALIAKYGHDAVIGEITKIQARERR